MIVGASGSGLRTRSGEAGPAASETKKCQKKGTKEQKIKSKISKLVGPASGSGVSERDCKTTVKIKIINILIKASEAKETDTPKSEKHQKHSFVKPGGVWGAPVKVGAVESCTVPETTKKTTKKSKRALRKSQKQHKTLQNLEPGRGLAQQGLWPPRRRQAHR